MVREELAWAAGFFDGEGSTLIQKRPSGNRHLKIQIGQATFDGLPPQVLLKFKQAVFGLGYIGNIFPARSMKHKPQYWWRGNGLEVTQAVVAMMWPWLGEIKREQYRRSLRTALTAPNHRFSGHGGRKAFLVCKCGGPRSKWSRRCQPCINIYQNNYRKRQRVG